MKNVYWLSRHALSPAQQVAVRALHGDVKVVQERCSIKSTGGLAEYIRERDGFVYAVAGAPHYLYAALAGLSFGVFENHHARRQDGAFGLAAVYHVVEGALEKVWVNPDPERDEGEALMPLARPPV